MSTAAQTESRAVAIRLGIALARIQARIKQESTASVTGLTPSQVAMLKRLADSDGLSVTELAAAEHVSQQAITQRLAPLKPTGFVIQQKDPHDARRKLVKITDAGSAALTELAQAEQTWLAAAIDRLDDDARAALARAAEIMELMAGSDRA